MFRNESTERKKYPIFGIHVLSLAYRIIATKTCLITAGPTQKTIIWTTTDGGMCLILPNFRNMSLIFCCPPHITAQHAIVLYCWPAANCSGIKMLHRSSHIERHTLFVPFKFPVGAETQSVIYYMCNTVTGRFLRRAFERARSLGHHVRVNEWIAYNRRIHKNDICFLPARKYTVSKKPRWKYKTTKRRRTARDE